MKIFIPIIFCIIINELLKFSGFTSVQAIALIVSIVLVVSSFIYLHDDLY